MSKDTLVTGSSFAKNKKLISTDKKSLIQVKKVKLDTVRWTAASAFPCS